MKGSPITGRDLMLIISFFSLSLYHYRQKRKYLPVSYIFVFMNSRISGFSFLSNHRLANHSFAIICSQNTNRQGKVKHIYVY
jgi:hypothetical protein